MAKIGTMSEMPWLCNLLQLNYMFANVFIFQDANNNFYILYISKMYIISFFIYILLFLFFPYLYLFFILLSFCLSSPHGTLSSILSLFFSLIISTVYRIHFFSLQSLGSMRSASFSSYFFSLFVSAELTYKS